jgi:hypothetical protein
MISWGFAYGGSVGYAGYRPYGVVESVDAAEKAIRGKLAGQNVVFVTRDGKTRAYADGQRTGYIFFVVSTELWVAVNSNSLPATIIAKGSLETVKRKVRKYIDKEHKNFDYEKVSRMTVAGRGNSRRVNIGYPSSNTMVDSEIRLVKVM